MDVRIGTTLDGQAARFDISTPRTLLLVGDVGRGKTTTARYLTRWWLANTARHAHVYARTPSEWADLRCSVERPERLHRQVERACRPRTCLVVIDDMDLIEDEQLALLPLGTGTTILTSHGGNNLTGQTLLGANLSCVGLVRPNHSDASEAAVLDGQGRLDWPIDTVAVIADQRGPVDFPCHRWQVPGCASMAAAL
jgi:hypothetical protein